MTNVIRNILIHSKHTSTFLSLYYVESSENVGLRIRRVQLTASLMYNKVRLIWSEYKDDAAWVKRCVTVRNGEDQTSEEDSVQ